MKKQTKKVESKVVKVSKYDPKKIESKWTKIWDKQKTFKAKIDPKKKKFHVLDMFPYPSGEGLHVGHAKTFGGSDVYTRFKRLQGFNVLHSTGWDAFGLPAEQFALKMKTNPKIQTKKNTDNFEKQMKRIGFSYDWERTVNTTDPEFYKWTQWIFKQLYKDGLCEESYEPINWCPSCKTGLANEDLEDGKCERCGSVVEKKPIRQWVIKITEYAETLLSGLNEVGWKENIKEMQRNWIGKSEGAEIDFTLKGKEVEKKFTIFTTRPDTLFGCTYCVFAPEHQLVKEYLDKGIITNKVEIEKYISEAKNKSEIERSAEGKEKTGVKLEGVVAINPANKKAVPVYIADYVLATYGSGAIMAVPAHDQRDFEFAKKFNIPVTQVVAPWTVCSGESTPKSDKNIVKFNAASAVVKHWEKDLYYIIDFTVNTGIVGGSLEEGENVHGAIKREITEETGYKNIKKLTHVLEHAFSRGYKKRKDREEICHDSIFLAELENDERDEITDLHTKKGEWKTLEQVLKDPMFINHHKLYFDIVVNNKLFTEGGLIVNSGEFDGMQSEEAKEKIAEFVGGKMVTKYRLKDWVFARQRYWGEPFPIVFDENHKSYLVADKDLPVKLPDVKNYEPTGDGESPLKNIKNWVEVYGTINKDGEFEEYKKKVTKEILRKGKLKKFTRETNTMPQWAGSSWYWLRYMDPKNKKAMVDKKAEKYWGQVDMYIGGMEHATRHLIYGRFWNRFLFDKKIISTKEPFQRLEAVGLVLGPGGVKMSKRLGNVINPDDICNMFGADTLRTYISFSSSFHDSFSWDEKAIVGSRRFIERVWSMQTKITTKGTPLLKGVDTNAVSAGDLETILHQTIKKCEEDFEKMQYNTAIAQMMIFVNAVEKAGGLTKDQFVKFVTLLSPVAPFVTSEILGNLKIKNVAWPKWDAKKIQSKNVNIALQINGKLRDTFACAVDLGDEEVKKLAEQTEGYKKWIVEAGAQIRKVIVVKNKIVNIVV